MTPKPLPFKYYYDGQLVRTSRHEYTHGVINGAGELIACRNGADKAEKARQDEKRTMRASLAYYEAKLKAIRAGRTTYEVKFGRSSTWHRLKPGTPEAPIIDMVERLKKDLDYIEEHYKVVELVKV